MATTGIFDVCGYVPLIVSSQDILFKYERAVGTSIVYVSLQDMLDTIQWDIKDPTARTLRYTSQTRRIIEYVSNDPDEYVLNTYVEAALTSNDWRSSANIVTHMISTCRNVSLIVVDVREGLRGSIDYTSCTIEDVANSPQYIYCANQGNKYVVTIVASSSGSFLDQDTRIRGQIVDLIRVLSTADHPSCTIVGILAIGSKMYVYSFVVTKDLMEEVVRQEADITLDIRMYPDNGSGLDMKHVNDRYIMYSLLNITFHDMQ